MLHRIEMQIIHMTRIIPLIADCMLPEAPLPDTPLAPRRAHKRTPFGFRKLPREPRLDESPTIGEIGIAGRQGPDAMQMIRQHHPTIDHKRPATADIPYHRAQQIDMPDQSIVRETLQQIGREEITATGNAVTAIIRQGSFPALFLVLTWILQAEPCGAIRFAHWRPTLAAFFL